MKIEDLIGYQLLKIDNEQIIVSKDNKQYVLTIEADEGDCCGYNEIKTQLFIKDNSKNNPIITKVEIERFGRDYDGDEAKITFYGLNKKLATIDSRSSSRSGWNYGACVTIVCKELNLKEEITSF